MRGASRGDPEVEQRKGMCRRTGTGSFGLRPGNWLQVCGARGQASQACTREALGHRPSPLTGDCLEWLHGCGRRRRKLPDEGGHRPLSRRRKLRSRGQKSPQVERRVASVPIARRAPPKGGRLMVAPPGAPSPRFSRGEKTYPREGGEGLRRTRRRLNNTGAFACAPCTAQRPRALQIIPKPRQ